MVDRVGELASRQSGQASDAARAGYERLTSLTDQWGRQMTDTVRQRPVESAAIVFGLGVIVGAFCLMGRRD